MTEIAENNKNNEGFDVVSSQMLLGRKISCKDTVPYCRKTKEKVRGPLSEPFEGPLKAHRAYNGQKMTKIIAFLTMVILL